MTPFHYFVGVDIASETFTACVGTTPWAIVMMPETFDNDEDGFAAFLNRLNEQDFLPEQTVVCMEATGVYGEGLAYFLFASGYRVAVEPPLNIQRKAPPNSSKNDDQDSQHISEYACRYADKLSFWKPKDEILEQIKVLLTTRHQLSTQLTAHKNGLHALERKKVTSELAEKVQLDMIEQTTKHLKAIDAEIRRLIDSNPTFKAALLLLLSVPGIGLQLAAHLIILTQYSLDPRVLSAFVGICPYEHESGTSVYRSPTSRHYGPPASRKLLYLAACSVRTHQKGFRQYYLRKVAEGKPGKLVLNNIQNKLLKIACAVLRSHQPFIPNYVSVNPLVLSGA